MISIIDSTTNAKKLVYNVRNSENSIQMLRVFMTLLNQ